MNKMPTLRLDRLYLTDGDLQVPCEVISESLETGVSANHLMFNVAVPYAAFMRLYEPRPLVPRIERVIFNPPATIVLWEGGTKTVVKCNDGDEYSPEHGLALCIAKRAFANKGNYNDVFRKWIPDIRSDR